jgi:Trk-type K+ transport system membrane component
MKNAVKLEYVRKRRKYNAPYWTRWRIVVVVVLLLFAGPCGFVVVYEAFANIVNAIYRATR